MVNLILSGCLMLLLSGCGWDGTPTRKNDFVPVTSIEISAITPTIELSRKIAAQTSTKLKAIGNHSGLFTEDITDQVVWSSDSPPVASFPYATGPNRSRVKGGPVPGGTVNITAKLGSVSATPYTLTVTDAAVRSMVITPAAPSVPKGLTSQFAVIGTFSDTTTQDLTFDATWDSIDKSVATVSNDTASKGLAQAVAVGASSISATFDGVSDSTAMTVTAPVLQSIALTPANPSILTLSTKKISATGTYSNGSTSDLSSLVAWSSSNTAIATIAGDGTVTTLMQGSTTISATLDGVSQSTTVKATGGNLTGITVSPAAVTLVKGTTGRITATGTFSNGSTRDITGMVTWKVTDPTRATVTTPVGTLAWLKPLEVTPGTGTSITATYGSLTPAAATLMVVAPQQLQSMTLSTTSLELKAGTSTPLTVTATFTGGITLTQDVTTISGWESSDGTIATVGTSGVDAGRVTGVAAGVATGAINATYTYNGTTVSVPAATRATVTVKAPTLLSLTISPVTAAVAPGYSTSFTAMANYGDDTQVNVTRDTKWSWVVDAPNVAILSDSVNQPGQVVGVDIGSAKLTASFGGKTPTQNATITVTGP